MAKKYKHGDMVFWGDTIPYWVIKWQPENGTGAYWLINAAGESGVATPEELTLDPIWRKQDQNPVPGFFRRKKDKNNRQLTLRSKK